MDLRYTPHDDRPRSTPEPIQSSPTRHLQQQSEVTVSVAMVHPGTGQLSGNGRGSAADEGVCEDRGGEKTTIGLGPLSSSSGTASDEREESGRPSSAPARTPTSGGHTVIELTAASPRPRIYRPFLAMPTENIQSDTVDMAPSSYSASARDRTASPDDLDSSDLREDETPDQYSELSPGPSGETRFQCNFCSFSTQLQPHMRHHLANHSEHKIMKCALCGFSTAEKGQFRRHKRLHQRNNPTSMMHCDKCQFSTQVSRKMREHYSRSHNEDLGSSFFASSMHMRTSSFNASPNFSRTTTGCSTDGGYFLHMGGSRGLHAYRLSQPQATLQFEPGDPSSTVLAGCSRGGFAPTGYAGLRYDSEQHILVPGDSLASSDQLNSVMTNMIGQPRVPATSTITSCEYPARPANPHPDLNSFSPLRSFYPPGFRDLITGQLPTVSSRTRRPVSINRGEAIKVKTEPLECDGVSDVSSSGVSGLFDRDRGGLDQERPRRYTEPQTTITQPRYRHLYQTVVSQGIEQSDEIAPSGGDASRVSQSSEAASSRMEAHAGSEGDSEREERRGSAGEGDGLGQHLLFNIKSETSNVAVQCSGSSSMKSELAPTVTVAAAEHSTECRRGHRMVERGVQCELLSSSPRRVTSRTLSTDSEQQSLTGSDTRCSHCGITFDDDVLFSIHIGCHSHTDPFLCNVCGKKCHDKYVFYSHILRGHHF